MRDIAKHAGAVLLSILPLAASAQEGPLQDNSFFAEEAYNQEDGVVQHISTFQLTPRTRDWFYSFTQEWPAPNLAHQVGATVPVMGSPGDPRALGDVAINYRYQLLGSGTERVALAPRVSLVVPTGDWRKGHGLGATGIDVNIPLTVAVSRSIVLHENLGGMAARHARAADGTTSEWMAVHAASSVVWLAASRFNVLLEAAGTRVMTETETEDSLAIVPGFRAGVDVGSLQIVPGIAAPVTFLPGGEREYSVFLYLSFEHPFRSPRE